MLDCAWYLYTDVDKIINRLFSRLLLAAKVTRFRGSLPCLHGKSSAESLLPPSLLLNYWLASCDNNPQSARETSFDKVAKEKRAIARGRNKTWRSPKCISLKRRIGRNLLELSSRGGCRKMPYNFSSPTACMLPSKRECILFWKRSAVGA